MSAIIRKIQINLKKTRNNNTIGILLLSIFYVVGLIGIAVLRLEDFLLLTPFNLLISLIIILWYHPKWIRGTIITLILSYFVGFFIEVAGVNTGIIFGEYEYGSVLGWKLWNTPLIIGINWAMLIYAVGMTANWWLSQVSLWIKAVFGASIMMLLDMIIEPVAIRYDFWTWEAVEVPLQNYISWWIISFVLLAIFHFFHTKMTNKVASALLLWQFVFFMVLLLVK